MANFREMVCYYYTFWWNGYYRVYYKTGTSQDPHADEPWKFKDKRDALRRVYELNGWEWKEYDNNINK